MILFPYWHVPADRYGYDNDIRGMNFPRSQPAVRLSVPKIDPIGIVQHDRESIVGLATVI